MVRAVEKLREHFSKPLRIEDVARELGYDDASHFNRECKRHFGQPPMRDVERLRELATASTRAARRRYFRSDFAWSLFGLSSSARLAARTASSRLPVCS